MGPQILQYRIVVHLLERKVQGHGLLQPVQGPVAISKIFICGSYAEHDRGIQFGIVGFQIGQDRKGSLTGPQDGAERRMISLVAGVLGILGAPLI